ncbi:MAG: hypothetical protein E6L02_05275 [Thaumarchaeota archaeon]|nr:MAG: hypothetical protein E6L02_05275 [Nitrososphaerota archaeon]
MTTIAWTPEDKGLAILIIAIVVGGIFASIAAYNFINNTSSKSEITVKRYGPMHWSGVIMWTEVDWNGSIIITKTITNGQCKMGFIAETAKGNISMNWEIAVLMLTLNNINDAPLC